MSVQKYSIFHETDAESLKAWHRPYAKAFVGRGPVLDVGCGPGYFSEMLKHFGEECLGLDFDPEMVALSNERGQDAKLGDESWIRETKMVFGGIHVSHVVEHLWGRELEVLLESSERALRPGGLIVIRTPNWENRFVRERLFWMDHTHKRPYPRELLVRMLNDLGMDEVQSGSEPYGMNDTFVVAKKPRAGVDKPSEVCFENGPSSGARGSWKNFIKGRVRRFLGID